MIVIASEPPHLEIVHHLVQMERQMACQNGIILGRLGGKLWGEGHGAKDQVIYMISLQYRLIYIYNV